MDRTCWRRNWSRWIRSGLLAALLVLPTGCYCTNWRWIWEDVEYCPCYYETVVVQPGDVVGP